MSEPRSEWGRRMVAQIEAMDRRTAIMEADLKTLSSLKPLAAWIAWVATGGVVSLVVGGFCAGMWYAGLNRDLASLKESIAELQKSSKHVSEAVDSVRDKPPYADLPRPEVIVHVVLTSDMLADAKIPGVLEFNWPLPTPIDPAKAAKSSVVAAISPGSSEVFANTSIQISADLDKSGKTCNIRLSSPEAVKLRAYLVRMGGKLPMDVSIQMPAESKKES